MLRRNTTLTTLNLGSVVGGNPIGDAGAGELAGALREDNATLMELILD